MKYLLFVTAICFSSPVLSEQPVHDWLNYVQNKLEFIEQKMIVANTKVNNFLQLDKLRKLHKSLKQLEYQVQRLDRQLEKMDKQYLTFTGHYGYGHLLRNQPKARVPKSQQELEEELHTPKPDSAIAIFKKAYVESFQPKDARRFDPTEKKRDGVRRNTVSDATIAGSVISDVTFEYIADREDIVQRLVSEIEKTDNLKSSADLQNLNVAELHRTMIDLLYLTSVMVKMQASNSAEQIAKRDALLKFVSYKQKKYSE